MDNIRLLIDIGSTFTKVIAIDMAEATIVGRAQSPSTVEKDVTIGIRQAIEKLKQETGIQNLYERKALACSSGSISTWRSLILTRANRRAITLSVTPGPMEIGI